MTGTLRVWGNGRGYGYVVTNEGEKAFVHMSEVPDELELALGDRLEFDVAETAKGLRAVNIRACSSGALDDAEQDEREDHAK